ncbi:hypothetical protein WG66_008715, partial [Moniliophthora roreri]
FTVAFSAPVSRLLCRKDRVIPIDLCLTVTEPASSLRTV